MLAHFSEILPEDHVVAVAAEVLEGPPQASEPTAATLTEGADQGLPSPLLALLLIVFGPERIGQMVRYVGRLAYRAPNSVEGSEADPTASVAARKG